ncbi:MAG: HAMP domain-containing histidine kinase, partial [Lewinella sp.]|nr:HAMP domain-containing histidine kinase [Lewinella sp.]
YLAPPGRAGAQQPSYPNLKETPYRINLFGNTDQEAPAELRLHFPAKSDVLWSDLWLNFLGAFLCAAIILACFGYTIWVIFHQKKISEMKTDFINNMTHEFKTPIATISLAADSITSSRIAGDPNKVARFANIIKQENKRMNSQVEKVLQMAQIDKHEFKLRLSEVDLHEVITRAIENISLQVEQREGVAEAALLADNAIVEGDLTHISNMVNNLLDNANKYSPEKPHITVTTHTRPKGVEVQVSDQGMGMSKEARKHIFDSFYRVHTGDRHDVKGFGLGLSYVRAMITAHQGTVDVQSELGKGSTFTLFFPYKQ